MKLQFHEQISPITLRIKDYEMEKAYQIHIASSLLWYRLAVLLGISIYFSFCIVDYFLFNTLLLDFLKVRIFIVSPLIIIAFLLTFWKRYPEYAQIINITTITVGGIGIILMGLLGRNHPEISRNYAGLVPFFLYIYAFLRIRFVNGAIAGTGLLIGYAIVESYLLNTPRNIFIANIFYMSASNIAGMCVAYLLEYQGKKEYLLQGKFEELSIRDAMTGLYNRYYFNNVCLKDIEDFIDVYNYESFIEKRTLDPSFTNYGLIILDIDHFKKINDTYGHDVGDTVLIEIAKILKENVRKTDDVLRWGGEEFLIILKSTQKEYIHSFVKKIGKSVQEYDFRLNNGKKLSIKCSIGYICIPFEEQQGVETLIKYADQALYKAKNSGRNKSYQAVYIDGHVEYSETNWNEPKNK